MSYYDEGREAGEAAGRSRGGTRGADWHADRRGLTGIARADFIQGFEEAVAEVEPIDWTGN